MEKFEEALLFAEPLVEHHEVTFGPAGGNTLEVRRYLVSILKALGRLDRAQQILRQTVELTLKHRKPGHKYIERAQTELDEFLASSSSASETSD